MQNSQKPIPVAHSMMYSYSRIALINAIIDVTKTFKLMAIVNEWILMQSTSVCLNLSGAY